MRFQPAMMGTILVPLLVANVLADKPEPLRTISVVGEGKVTATPDMATIVVENWTQDVSAKESLRKNNAIMQRIFAELKKYQIAKKDLQTSNFQVRPVQEHHNMQIRTEYRVSNQLRVRVRKLPQLGELIDAVVQAGGNRISGISFGVSDTTAYMNQARGLAVTNARSRADVYASAAKVRVGRVLKISEQSAALPRPFRLDAVAFVKEAATVPIATGELEFRTTVSIVYELTDPK